MPPQQCPECGRFLKNALVESLAERPAPCPGCDVELTSAMLAGTAADPGGASDPSDPSVPATGQASAQAQRDVSVRPPDLEPVDVRSADDDPLARWDVGATADEVASWHVDQRPFPTDAVVVAGAAVIGLGVGCVADREARARGAAVGFAAGAVAGAIVRRIWRLEP